VAGWPPDAEACRAEVMAWGPWPYRRVSVPCDPTDPEAPVEFSFDLLPVGEWGIRVELRWTSADGSPGGRFDDFPESGWFPVEAGETTSVALVADRPGGGLSGRVVDDAAGMPISGQFEPGAPMVHLIGFDRRGEAVGHGGNACDGGYQMWVPAGEVAVAAVIEGWNTPEAFWRSEWIGADAEFDPSVLDARADGSIDPALIPDGAWFDVGNGSILEVDMGVSPGPAWRPPGDAGWFPWWQAPTRGEELDDSSPWRDPSFWIGRTITVRDEGDVWPPPLLVDGDDLGLHGDDGRRSGLSWVVARPAPPPGSSGQGGEPAFYPAYALLIAMDGDVIGDARYVALGPGEQLSIHGLAPHDPATAYAALIAGPAGCAAIEGPAVAAWRIVDGSIEDVDPSGVFVDPYW
jgi:hypothetical protein